MEENLIRIKLKELLLKPSFKLLIIEDHLSYLEGLKMVFRKFFSNAEITAIENSDQYKDVHILIQEQQYDLIVIDGHLNKWEPHDLFKSFGPNIVLFIKEFSPWTLVFSVSADELPNKVAMENGADFSAMKDKITERLKELLVPKTSSN